MVETKTTNAAPSVPPDSKPAMHMHHSKKLTKEHDGILFRGNPELKTYNSRERYEHDPKEVKLITKHLSVTCNVTDLRRFGKFSERKDRTHIAKNDSDYAEILQQNIDKKWVDIEITQRCKLFKRITKK